MLIIFDLDNTCIYASETFGKHVLQLNNLYVRLRPGFYALRNWLYKNNYEIAVWSAGTDDYVNKISNFLFPKLKWIRTRKDCDTEFNVKYLHKIKEEKFMLIDDNFIHLLHNDFDDRIYHIPGWNGNNSDKEFVTLQRYIQRCVFA